MTRHLTHAVASLVLLTECLFVVIKLRGETRAYAFSQRCIASANMSPRRAVTCEQDGPEERLVMDL